MPVLSKSEALLYVEGRADVIDAPGRQPNPFATSAWLKNFIEQVVQPDWQILAPEVRGDGVGLMLLYRDSARATHARSLANFYTSLFSPLIGTATDRQSALHSLARELTTVKPRLSTVTFEPLDEESEDTGSLSKALTSNTWFVRRFFRFGNLSLPSEGLDFERYMASRDSQLRNTIHRKSKKFLSSGVIELITEPGEVDAAMDAYEEIYLRSWKRPEPYPGFARGWAQICASKGWLRLGVARMGGVPVAAQIWFIFEKRAYIFKLAYDEAYSKWSAGTVLTAHLMRHVLDIDHVVEVDFLSGDDPYKATWMSHRRDRIGLVACNPRTLSGLLAASTELAGRTRAELRSWVSS